MSGNTSAFSSDLPLSDEPATESHLWLAVDEPVMPARQVVWLSAALICVTLAVLLFA